MPTLSSADPLWYKDAVFYQLHVKSFADSNGDGIGDFPGLTSKLDYLASLGVDCLWLQPMYPSPFSDDGYDISDYTSIHPSYGTLQDFEHFLEPAHARGLRVIIELVLNHTSDQHAWFQEARSSTDNPRRDWYVWSDTDDRYRGVRIIFLDTELSNWAWDPVSKAYYWHRFFSHQPDLNYDNPAVREEIWKVMKFWLESRRRRISRRRRALPDRARGHLVREPARDPRRAQGAARAARRPLHRQGAARRSEHVARGRPPVLRRLATSSTCRSTFRSCRACSWRCGSRTASRSSTSSSARRAFPTRANGASSSAITTS